MRDYAALAGRVRAAAIADPSLSLRVYGRQTVPSGSEASALPGAADEAYDLFIVDVPPRDGRRPRFHVLINGGTHGDEPAGATAAVAFLEQKRYQRWPDVAFTVMPCTNPWGYVHDTREGPGGRDLNRSFRRATPLTPQVSLLKRALRGKKFDMFLDCHEDVDAPGLYVFAPGDLGRAIVDAVRRVGPIHEGDLVDGEIPLDGGVVVMDSLARRQRRRRWTTWPLPLWVARYHLRNPLIVPGLTAPLKPELPAAGTSPAAEDADSTDELADDAEVSDFPRYSQATIETPTQIPLEQRVAMHHAALDAALATLQDK
jgi:hypothetical protein